MIGTGKVISNRLRSIFADKDCSRIFDFAKPWKRIFEMQFEMFGRYPVASSKATSSP